MSEARDDDEWRKRLTACLLEGPEILLIDNVKFHLDQVPTLGDFLEIEAIADVPDTAAAGDDAKEVERLRAQVLGYMAELGVREGDLIARSYSDLLLEKRRR